MEKTAISVQIYNETYVLRTSAPQTQVLKIAQNVDERMKRLAADKQVQNREKLAVWTALDLAAELKDKKKRGLTVFVMWRRYYKRTLAAGKKPYGKSQFFKLFKRYDTGSFRFEFQYTETMKKVSALISDYVCIPSSCRSRSICCAQTRC